MFRHGGSTLLFSGAARPLPKSGDPDYWLRKIPFCFLRFCAFLFFFWRQTITLFSCIPFFPSRLLRFSVSLVSPEKRGLFGSTVLNGVSSSNWHLPRAGSNYHSSATMLPKSLQRSRNSSWLLRQTRVSVGRARVLRPRVFAVVLVPFCGGGGGCRLELPVVCR